MSRAPRLKTCMAILGIFCLLSLTLSDLAWARAGGGSSSGSTGSRSVSRPSSPTTRPTPPPPPPSQSYQQRPTTPPPQSGGFMRGLAGGLAGGFLGSMLFRGVAGAGGGAGGGGGGGMGLFDLILIGAVLYGLYYFLIKRRRGQGGGGSLSDLLGGTTGNPPPPPSGGYAPPPPPGASYVPPPPPGPDMTQDLAQGLGYIRSMDPGFDEQAFKDQVMDTFFQIQAAYGQRDVASVGRLLTDEMRGILSSGIDQLKAQGQINRLENIAVRTVELTQAWQEQGRDYLTALITANLLDYTVDDKSGQVVSGSNTQPVKFQELWTFTRPVGPGPWQLTAITQTN
ncbi:MAG: Tim44 domain-containing protein [Pseudomonadota bacterium]